MRYTVRQKGAVILTVAFTLLFLLGFMGIALDFGHLFVVKTEMQTAMDSCALAAAQELDGASDALSRAKSAGKTAGNLNKVNFQGASVGIVDADITFTPAGNEKYVTCKHTKGAMRPWLLQAMSAFSGDASYAADQSVFAQAKATRASAQTACAIPVQINPKAGGVAPDWGYVSGEWIPSVYNEGASNAPPSPGYFGWANLDGSTSASTLSTELQGTGFCTLKTGDTIGTTGAKVSASVAWNSRFGLYKNGAGNPDINSAMPDTTGYAYTATNWSSTKSAIGDFLNQRVAHKSYGNTADTVTAGNTITGLSISNSYKDSDMGTYAAGAHALATHGGDRRLVYAPIVVASKIQDWACVLMLHPIDGPNVTVYLEYAGNAANSHCSSAGLPGGSNGPLVSALVQ